MALDSPPVRAASISAISAPADCPRASASRSKAAQNSGSRLTEVGCPAIRTEYLASARVCSRQEGPIICSGLTHSANCSSVSNPSSSAAAFSVVPSACAFFTTLAALSYPIWGFNAVTSIRLS